MTRSQGEERFFQEKVCTGRKYKCKAVCDSELGGGAIFGDGTSFPRPHLQVLHMFIATLMIRDDWPLSLSADEIADYDMHLSGDTLPFG